MLRNALTLLALTIAVVAFAQSAVDAQQTGPVLHLDDQGLFLTVDDPTENVRLVVLWEGNPGDFLRFMPDGRIAINFQTNEALLLLVDLDSGNILLGGPGSASLSETDLCDFDAGICFPDGERTVLHVQGQLAPAPGADPVADVFVQQVIIKQVERLFRFDIAPK